MKLYQEMREYRLERKRWVKTLEQQGHNEALSGDERIQALEKEVSKDTRTART